MSSIDDNEDKDMNEIKDIMDYMLEAVSLSISINQNNGNNNDNNNDYNIDYNYDTNDNEIQLSQIRSHHCIVNEDDDEVIANVKDLVDYMLELVSTAVPFKSTISSTNINSFDDNNRDIEVMDIEKPDSDFCEIVDINENRYNNNENEFKDCFVCGKAEEIKYKIKINGKLHNSCSWDCVQKLKNNDFCIGCCSIISGDLQGYRPNFGAGNATLCSEECLTRFDVEHQPNTECNTCHEVLMKEKPIFYWQTMEFCSPECVQTKQLVFGSKCAQCQTSVNRQSLGKYSVRFGDIIKQFCVGTCLEAFKKSLKVCAFCQKDLKFCSTICIATFGFGEKMRLREFCDQICKSQYELMLNSRSSFQIQCFQCQRIVDSKSIIDFTFESKKYSLCSYGCVAAFKYDNKLKTIFCENCHKYNWTQPSNRSTLHILHYSGMTCVFCTKKCMSMYVLKNRKIVACLCCKVKKYNFDLIERFDWSKNDSRLFCSLNCLTLFDIAEAQKDKINSNNTNKVNCDQCKNLSIPQFYLKIDESLYSFCSYQCVFQYQRQFAPNSLIAMPSNTSLNDSSSVTFGNSQSLTQSRMWTPSFFTQSRPQIQQKGQTVLLSQVRPNLISNRRPIPSSTPLSTVNKTMPSNVSPITTNVSLAIPSSESTTGQMITTQTSTSSSAGNQTIIKEIVKETKEVIVKVPPAKQMKNKCTYFRPPSQTKATSCRPFQVNAEVQTEPQMKVICPILLPVPVFVPVPVAYMQPLAFPLPLPVPVFFETKPESPQKPEKDSQKQSNDDSNARQSFNSDNFNLTEQQIGELLTLPEELLGENQTVDASVVQNILMEDSANNQINYTNDSSKRKSNVNESDGRASKRGRKSTESTPRGRGRGRGRGGRGGRGRGKGSNSRRKEWEMSSSEEEEEEIPSEKDSDYEAVEATIESSNNSRSSEDVSKQIAVIPTTRGRGRGRKSDLNTSLNSSLIDVNTSGHSLEEQKKGRRGRKKKEVDAVNDAVVDCESQFSTNTPNNGINALRIWLRQSPVYVNTKNILELHQNYLSEIFCKFVEEICQVHGQEYSPDYIYLLCLDLQKHLADHNRLDNIFMDTAYKQFIHAIHTRLVGYNPQLTCIMEEKLWECGQLGAHSPTVLLNTVMFLATKYFHMTLLDEHTQFAFNHLQKGWTDDGTQCLVYQTIRRGRGRKKSLTLFENVENQMRCPVKLFEFYLSKWYKYLYLNFDSLIIFDHFIDYSPEVVCQRRDMFYLYPIEGCVPDSQTWYTSTALTNASVNKMLQRILVVREIVALGSQPNL